LIRHVKDSNTAEGEANPKNLNVARNTLMTVEQYKRTSLLLSQTK
jgi:hypothetical protein